MTKDIEKFVKGKLSSNKKEKISISVDTGILKEFDGIRNERYTGLNRSKLIEFIMAQFVDVSQGRIDDTLLMFTKNDKGDKKEIF